MKNLIIFISILITFCFFNFNCEESTKPKEESNVPAELVGAWSANQFLMTNNADTREHVDLIQLGITFLLTIQSNENYSSTLNIPLQSPIIESGIFSVQNNQMIISPDNDNAYTMGYSVSNNVLSLIDPNSEFDSNDDGIELPCTAQIILQKN